MFVSVYSEVRRRDKSFRIPAALELDIFLMIFIVDTNDQISSVDNVTLTKTLIYTCSTFK